MTLPPYVHLILTGRFQGTEFTERISAGVFKLQTSEGGNQFYEQVPDPKKMAQEQRNSMVVIEFDVDNTHALKIFDELDERLPATDGA